MAESLPKYDLQYCIDNDLMKIEKAEFILDA